MTTIANEIEELEQRYQELKNKQSEKFDTTQIINDFLETNEIILEDRYEKAIEIEKIYYNRIISFIEPLYNFLLIPFKFLFQFFNKNFTPLHI